MKKRKYTVWGIIEDMQGNYQVLLVNTYYNIASFHNNHQRIPCWCSEYPDILFNLQVGIDVFETESEADYAYYIRWELN